MSAPCSGLILTPVPGWKIFLGAAALHFLGGLGTTVAFHRALAHKSLRLNPVVRNVLTFFAMFNGGGSPLSWAANHRLHHAKSDTPEDISSPGVGGFWWSHLRWLWQAGAPPIKRYCKDMDKPEYRFWARAQMPILALAFFGGLAFGWTAFFWLGPIRLVFALHAQCFVNSVCHLKKDPGPDGTAMNVRWLSLMHFFQGENWHANHHERPGSARLGFTAGPARPGLVHHPAAREAGPGDRRAPAELRSIRSTWHVLDGSHPRSASQRQPHWRRTS